MTDKKQDATETKPVAKVYQAINDVMSALSKAGIGKERKNSAQNYAFRGIDDVYNSLCTILAENKLCMLPRVVERTCQERTTAKGTVMFYVNVIVEFTLVSSEDASWHVIRTVGEAMDSGDKATNKAQSAAYKYAALMTFCIPTEGTGKDSEEDTFEDVQPHRAPAGKTSIAPKTQKGNDPEKDEIIKAPHDPETGEILQPHEIQVPIVNDVGDPDRWARVYIAALRSSTGKADREAWVKFNAKLMGQLANYSPKAHKALTGVLEELRANDGKLPAEA